MASEKRLIDANDVVKKLEYEIETQCKPVEDSAKGLDAFIERVLPKLLLDVIKYLNQQPSVDAVEMPKGKPGDCLEWDNGAGFRQIYRISAVMICEDCIRYSLENFCPVVNHPNIVRILSLEEAEQEWREMCAKAMPREEPTMTAVCGERKE